MDKDDLNYIKPIRAFLLHWLNDQLGDGVKVVQVGANDGTMADPLSPIIARFDWAGLLIEPIPRYFKALKTKYKGNKKIVLKNVGISSEACTETIFHLSARKEKKYPEWARGLASFDKKHVMRAVAEEDISEVSVDCLPLSDLLEEAGFADAEVLVVDVEGAEKLVFSSFHWRQFRPKIIEVETRHLHARTKEWLFARFHRGGYDVYDFGFDTIAIRRGWLPASLRHLIGLTRLNEFKIEPLENT